MVNKRRGAHPFAGVVWVTLIAAAAAAIETGNPVAVVDDFAPGGIALVAAAAVYAARTAFELVQQQRSAKNGNGDDKMLGLQQRLLDLYSDHARAEERVLADTREAVRELRDHAVRAAVQSEVNGRALDKLAESQVGVHHALSVLSSALHRYAGKDGGMQ